MTAPIAYLRPDDEELFTVNPSGKFSNDVLKKQFPDSHHFEWDGEHLFKLGFLPVFDKKHFKPVSPRQ